MVNDDDMADDWAAAMAEQADADETLANPIAFEELHSDHNKVITNPELEVIVALTSTSARGSIEAIASASKKNAVKVIVFDPDFLRFDDPSFDSAIIEDTRNMGKKAISLIVGKIHGEPMPLITRFQPTLVTRDNLNTEEVRELTSMDWRPGRLHWRWRVIP